MSLVKLKNTRAGHKSALKRLLRKAEETKEKEDFVQSACQTLYESLEEKRKTLIALDKEILNATEEENVEAMEAEIIEADEYDLLINTQIKDFRMFIDANSMPDPRMSHAQPSFPPNNSNVPSQHMLQSLSSVSSQNQHLPKLTLPKFNGDVLSWQTFWDSFESSVHYNISLTDIQKFSYLKSLLTDEAAKTVGGFPLTHANYSEAIKILKSRYGQPHKIVDAYMQALLELRAPLNNLQSIRDFYDTIETYIRGLEALGQSGDSYGTLLIPSILNKLPEDFRIQLTRQNGSDHWPKLNGLRDSILKELQILQTGKRLKLIGNVESYTPQQTASFLTSANKKSKPIGRPEHRERPSGIREKPCVFCYEKHDPARCHNVTQYSHRFNIVRHKQLCFNCLGKHKSSECTSHFRCKNCSKKHHSSLCQENDSRNSGRSTEKTNTYSKTSVNVVDTAVPETASVNTSSTVNPGSNILLKTAIAPVMMKNSVTNANILFDEGAQRSFITEKLAMEMNIDLESTETEAITVCAFGNQCHQIRHLPKLTIQVQSIYGKKIPVEVLVVPTIASPLSNHGGIDTRKYKYLRNLRLAHPVTNEDRFEISLLIGADFYWNFVQDIIIRGKGPTAVKSEVGFLLSGPLHDNARNTSSIGMYNILVGHKIEEFDLQKFWKLESLGISEMENEIEVTDYLQKYQESSIDLREGRYVAKLPWKPDHEELPTNYAVTKRRTESVVNRLSKQPGMLSVYDKIIKDQEKRGFIEKVDVDECQPEIVHYIPHHPVAKDSTTTPIRIVYDCSCRQTPQHASLNDCLMNTPPVLNDLSELLIRFRLNPVAIVTDIEKAFLHVGLHEKDRDATRFLWIKDTEHPNDLETYRFKSVLFGATCSPFILNAVLLKHLNNYEGELSKLLARDLYVDNILSSVKSATEAQSYFKEAREMMLSGGFNLRSWTSNSEQVRELAKIEGVLDTDELTKVLGMRWNASTDELMYATRPQTLQNTDLLTKREILRLSSKVYDPLGLLGPVTVRSKILMQHIWKERYEWDEILPEDIQKTWNDLAKDITEATKMTIPRCYTTEQSSSKTLHVFVDSSMKAYGAAAYIVDGNETKLVMARNRVAPVKTLTLPQLELMAAVIGARLARHVKNALECSTVVLWSDSQIVLQWINTTKQLKQFVSNRVKEIRDITSDYEWRYCPTADNPADLLTRGIDAKMLTESSFWMKGPTWITNKSEWPTSNVSLSVFTEGLVQTITSEKVEINESTGINMIMNIQNYSTYMKVLRVTAYVLRFVHNCRTSTKFRTTGEILQNEMKTATKLWIRNCQETSFKEECDTLSSKSTQTSKTSRIRQLRLFLDGDNLIRCRGRLHNAPLTDDTKFPYLLDNHHPLTKLIVMDAHHQILHSGVNATITHLRQSFWIPSIRQLVRKLLNRCVTCKKVIGKPYSAPDPPPLQKDRVQDSPPFTVTGIDFTGALTVKDKNGTLSKAYICLFTCAATRAIHLELVSDLREETFLQAFRRFTSRKSLPRIVISDNACTFISASREIRQLFESTAIQQEFSSRGIDWKFIPKRAPWFGGWWERLIALTKTTLKKTLGRSLIDMDTLHTITIEIEKIMNDRPLTYVSTDIDDNEPLTPAHLLYGRRITSMPYTQPDINIRNFQCTTSGDISRRAEKQSEIIEHFWNQWRKEYLTQLRQYHVKTGNNDIRIKVGDMVLIHDEKPRYKWKTAIVEKLVKGNDGLVRSAVIRTANECTTRPIVKLYPLEVCAEMRRSDDAEAMTSRDVPS